MNRKRVIAISKIAQSIQSYSFARETFINIVSTSERFTSNSINNYNEPKDIFDFR